MGLGWLRLLLSLLVMDAHFEGFRGTVQPCSGVATGSTKRK